MKNIIIGFIIGAGKIIPGVSGSVLAIIFGVYDKLLSIIANIRKIDTKKLIFLITISVGIIAGVAIFSDCVKYLLKLYYLPTMLLFIGLIIGGVPDVCKEIDISKNKPKLIAIFAISTIFPYILTIIFQSISKLFNNGIITYFFLGIIEAFSSIIPGISGTAIYISIGYYDTVINFFSNILNPEYLNFGIFFSLGIITGIVMVSKLITYLLQKHKNITMISILGFLVSSIVMMFIPLLKQTYDLSNIIIGIILMIIGTVSMIKFSKKLSK